MPLPRLHSREAESTLLPPLVRNRLDHDYLPTHAKHTRSEPNAQSLQHSDKEIEKQKPKKSSPGVSLMSSVLSRSKG